MTFTVLSALAEQFLALQRSTARRDPRQNGREVRALRHRETLLRSFLAYWRDRGCSWPIPSSLLLDWIAVGSDRQHPYRDQRRFYVARAFLQQVRTFEPATGIPENIYRPLCRRRTPHLFSDQEIQRLLEAVSQLRLYQPLRPLTIHTLIGLLASTGLRIGEAIALNVDDVKLDATPPHLLVQESKFGKSRCRRSSSLRRRAAASGAEKRGAWPSGRGENRVLERLRSSGQTTGCGVVELEEDFAIQRSRGLGVR